MTSLNVFTFSVLELSQTYLLILTQKVLDELALKELGIGSRYFTCFLVGIC